MAGRDDDTEPWYWQDDSLKLDSDSPLAAISRSFWDDFPQSEGDSQALFPPPPGSDSRYSNPSLFSHDSQESSSKGSPSSHHGLQRGEGYKRQRMLQFSGPRTHVLPTDSPSFSCVPLSSLENCVNPSIPGSDDFLMPIFTAASPLWYTRNDDASGPAIAKVQQQGDKWMGRCFEENNTCNTVHCPMEATAVPHMTPLPDISETKTSVSPFIDFKTGSCSQAWQPKPQQQLEAETLQGPVTPFSKPPLSGQRPLTDASRFKLKSLMPVAYPFALLKPYGAEGAVTLNDINKRLLSPPLRSMQQQQQQPVLPIENKRPPTQSGSAGLSGKSVVACTKIHTEGNGTITIMRTKG